MRPRFRKPIALAPDDVMARFEDCIDAGACPYVTRLYERQIEITVPDDRQHFWSPYLNLRFIEDGETAELDGRFGPNIGVWTMFVAAYAVLGIVGSVGLIMGISQSSIGQEPSGYWIAAACFGAIVLVYAIAMVGQRLAGPQMTELRAFVEETATGDPDVPS
jgi:hypothetical protein